MILVLIALSLLAIGFFTAEYGNTMAVAFQTLGVFLLLYGLPKFINSIVSTKYPTFGALVKGEEPYNEISSLPKRIAIVGAYAVFLVVIGLAGVLAVYFAVEAIK